MELPPAYTMTRRQAVWARGQGNIDSTHESVVFPPDGIPIEILTNQVDHRKPYKRDHGFRYEPARTDGTDAQ